MPGHEPVGFQRVVQVLQNQPGLDFGRLRHRVYVNHPVEPAQVQDDPAAHGQDPAHDAGAAAVWDQRNAGALGQRDNLRHLRGVRRPHDNVGQTIKRGVGVVGPVGRQSVGRVAVKLGRFRKEVLRSDYRSKAGRQIARWRPVGVSSGLAGGRHEDNAIRSSAAAIGCPGGRLPGSRPARRGRPGSGPPGRTGGRPAVRCAPTPASR